MKINNHNIQKGNKVFVIAGGVDVGCVGAIDEGMGVVCCVVVHD